MCNFYIFFAKINYESHFSLVFTLEILSKMIMVGMKMWPVIIRRWPFRIFSENLLPPGGKMRLTVFIMIFLKTVKIKFLPEKFNSQKTFKYFHKFKHIRRNWCKI